MNITARNELVNPDFGTRSRVVDCDDPEAKRSVRWSSTGLFASMLKAHTSVEYVDALPETLPEELAGVLVMSTIPGWEPEDPPEPVIATVDGVGEQQVYAILPYVLAMVERPNDIDGQRQLLAGWGVA